MRQVYVLNDMTTVICVVNVFIVSITCKRGMLLESCKCVYVCVFLE